MPDPFAASADSVTSPAEDGAALVPHDTNPVVTTPKALFIGTGGHIVMRGVNGTADITFRNVPSGSVLPFRPGFVRATGTTAADIVALY
jgi:hypothetical protein